jgi:hypothetical protein
VIAPASLIGALHLQPDPLGPDPGLPRVFGDLPDAWMLAGCTVIIASGLFIF